VTEVETPALLSRNQLRWACRRGMLELDLLLGGFVDHGYDELTFQEKVLFQQLLREADQQLLEYFMGQGKPDDPELNNVIEKIRLAVTA